MKRALACGTIDDGIYIGIFVTETDLTIDINILAFKFLLLFLLLLFLDLLLAGEKILSRSFSIRVWVSLILLIMSVSENSLLDG